VKKMFRMNAATIQSLVACFLLLIMLTLPVSADPIFVEGDDLSGSRTTPPGSGVVAGDGWTEAEGGFEIGWNIAPNGSDWNYSYTLRDKGTSDPPVLNPGLSHWILEVTPGIGIGSFSDIDVDPEGNPPVEGPKTWYAKTQPNPDMPYDIYGIKFDVGNTVTFTSTQRPVWGDFYAKDGRHSGIWATAWNAGFGSDPDPDDPDFEGFTPWIPTPDGVIPEPSTILLVTLSFVGITALGIRKKLKGTSSHK
jgi:hypothetical protein